MTTGQTPAARTPAQTAGDAAEDLVAARLMQRGWAILGQRLRVGRGELDLVAIDVGPPPELVIVEVRWRGRRDFGLAEETLDHRKRAHLRASIGRLLADGLPNGAPLPSLPIRVDLVVVEPGERIRHHRHVAL
ncbi:MAG TPA: YraN family protein [Candidatus Limnocylindrales bacterium]|nr:YraN family protein [Candidatus Limnocylindrales bacterium]